MRFVPLLFAFLVALPGLAHARALCLVGPTRGISEADAETVAALVCDELRKRGVDVGAPVLDAGEGEELYRVDLRPLGRKVYISVMHEAPAGNIVGHSQLALREIEEAPTAAPRLAEALVNHKPIESTATVDSLVGEETRKYRKKGGESFWGFGVAGVAVPGTDSFPGIGFIVRGAFETEDFGVLAEFRGGGGSPEDDTVGFATLTIGGRYFFMPTDWAPYGGAGLGWSSLSVDEDGFDGSKNGLGGYLEFGVEALRFYRSRLDVNLRAELPFFEVEDDRHFGYSSSSQVERRRYYVPLTFALIYMW